jgi:hypothetical protein
LSRHRVLRVNVALIRFVIRSTAARSHSSLASIGILSQGLSVIRLAPKMADCHYLQ